jgi:hypothetical protein
MMRMFFIILFQRSRFAQRQYQGALRASPDADIAPAEWSICRIDSAPCERSGQRFRRWITASRRAGHCFKKINLTK